jgi:hypothetical protein
MCRSIKTLYNFEPPATRAEIRASSLQFVRKLSGFTRPSQANEIAFAHAVNQVASAVQELLDSLVTTSPLRDRNVEASKARAKAAARRGLTGRRAALDGVTR